jgi:hypothetical protein
MQHKFTDMKNTVLKVVQAHTGWVNKTETNVTVYESNEVVLTDYFDAMHHLHDISDGTLLPQGEHKFRFHFTVSEFIITVVKSNSLVHCAVGML